MRKILKVRRLIEYQKLPVFKILEECVVNSVLQVRQKFIFILCRKLEVTHNKTPHHPHYMNSVSKLQFVFHLSFFAILREREKRQNGTYTASL